MTRNHDQAQTITVILADGQQVKLAPGDSLNIDSVGIVVFLTSKVADAMIITHGFSQGGGFMDLQAMWKKLQEQAIGYSPDKLE